MERSPSIDRSATKERRTGSLVLVALGLCLLAVTIVGASAQQNPAADTNPVSKKTDSGFEVFLQEARPTTDRDPLNNVPTYRFGSCPPGAVLGDMRVFGDIGEDVIVVHLGIKVLPNYGSTSLPLPILLDVDGKKYTSGRNTMLPDSLLKSLQRLKGTDEQLRCEFPFQVPKGTRITRVQFETVFFDLERSKAP